MKYSDAVNDTLVSEAMIQKVMDVYGVREDAAQTYLEKFDPDITEIAKREKGSEKWYGDLRKIIWGNKSDAEIVAHCSAINAKTLFKEVE